MNIESIELNNFRNLPNGKYKLGKRSFIEAKNFTGKTNLLEAIYWVTTDYCLDGSSDLSSFKPVYNPRAKVSVEIVFDNGYKFKKVVYENWVKTRGTSDERLTGHEVEYYCQDVKQKTKKEALSSLSKELGLSEYKTETTVDILRALTNPMYLFEQINHKDLRQYIIELVGEVSNDEVLSLPNFLTNPFTTMIKERLSLDKYKTETTIKYYKNQIKILKDEIEKHLIVIEDLKKVQDVPAEELESANKNLYELYRKINQLKTNQQSYVEEQIKIYDEKIRNAKQEMFNSKQDDFITYENNNKVLNEKIKSAKEALQLKEIERNQILINKEELEKRSRELNLKISNNQNNLERFKMQVENSRNLWKEINARKYINLIDLSSSQIICPHCGKIVNEEHMKQLSEKIENEKTIFEQNKKEELDVLVSKANQDKLEIQRLEKEIEEQNLVLAQLKNQINEVLNQLILLDDKVSNEQDIVTNLTSQMTPFANSEKTNQLIQKVNDLEMQMMNIKQTIMIPENIKEEISGLELKQEHCKSIISKHDIYENAQNVIESHQYQISSLTTKMNDFEGCELLVEEFIKCKLNLQDDKIKKVFGNEIIFKLVESNIKEGSWNEVCYPMITTKNGLVPFSNGSHSEKYITAIKIIEAIKKYQGLPDLPYVIDEAGTFDSETLNHLIVTNAQIIATRVNDSFNTPTIINQ